MKSNRPDSICGFASFALMALGFATASAAVVPPIGQTKPTRQERRKSKAAKQELQSAYRHWLDEEVPYIITDEERAAFKNLSTDEERERFIENFWDNRNPNPGSGENEFEEEYYRRIAYANEHYSSGVLGWRTDRGKIYIMYGPPDEIDAHPSGGHYNRPPEEGGGSTSTFPFEKWRYRYIEGIGNDVTLEFVDTSMSGEYHLSYDPGEKDAFTHVPGAGLTQMEAMNMMTKAQRFMNTDGTTLGPGFGMRENEFDRIDLGYKIIKGPDTRYKQLRESVTSHISANPLPFEVREDFIRVTEDAVMMPVTLQVSNRYLEFKNSQGVMQASLDIYGQIANLSGKVVTTFEDTVALDVPQSEFKRVFERSSAYQKTIPLRPGIYKLTVVVKDSHSGRTGSLEVGTRVPRYLDGRLSASSLILADVVQPLPTKVVGSGPFVIGAMKVRPSVSRVFTRDQNLWIYMQVYNLGLDPATHRPIAQVHYDVMKDGKVVLSKDESPDQMSGASPEMTLAKSLSLKSLAPG